MDVIRTLLRREESYAIHALIYAAENPGASASRMAADLQMPPAFLAKVLRKLSAARFLESRPGRNGGVTLRVDVERLSLLDVIEAMSGSLVVDTCQTQARCATQQRKGYCRLNAAWLSTSLAIRETFDQVRLAQLIENRRPG
jgi:Rrf2 family protein